MAKLLSLDANSDDQLSAHQFIELDLGARNLILVLLRLGLVSVLFRLALMLLVRNNVRLILFKLCNVLSQLVVLLLQSLDAIVHVGLRLVRDECFLEAVSDGAVV